MRLVDAHTHIDLTEREAAIELAEELAENGLWQLVTATTPRDCASVLDLAKASPRIIPTCGLHPWYADAFDLSLLEECLQRVPIIGEIGLDTVWTEVSLAVQLEAFVYQLQLAAEIGKPVILHTKGAEAEVLQWLKRFMPPKVMLHWYSGDAKYLADYVDLGCYFTLGPDINTNPVVQTVCQAVPLDRLLTETDGVEAVAWARGEPCVLDAVPGVILGILTTAASLRGVGLAQMQEHVYANLQCFLSKTTNTPVS